MAKRKVGRRKGGKKRGFYFRSGRGWYALDEQGKSDKLLDEHGEPLREKDAKGVQDAYARWRLSRGKPTAAEAPVVTVREVCAAYLRRCKSVDREKTFAMRARTLYDFCTGLPPRFRKTDPDGTKTSAKHRIHRGYGDLDVSELIPLHVDQWIADHPNWNGSIRTHIQAVKRAFNYAVEAGVISKNPVRGYKVAKSRARVAYITSEQEDAMYRFSKPAIAAAIRVCIRTGARPGSEFAAVTARHITDHGDRMEWRFSPEESKTKKPRIIRITAPEILAVIRSQLKRFPSGPIFRNTRGKPWTAESLKEAFTRLRNRLQRKGIEIGEDLVMYSCRHTYAKRALQGYWTGAPTNIETLCELMGNSRQVCWEHYAQWCDQYTEPLWKAC